jgi:hypothetical protein
MKFVQSRINPSTAKASSSAEPPYPVFIHIVYSPLRWREESRLRPPGETVFAAGVAERHLVSSASVIWKFSIRFHTSSEYGFARRRSGWATPWLRPPTRMKHWCAPKAVLYRPGTARVYCSAGSGHWERLRGHADARGRFHGSHANASPTRRKARSNVLRNDVATTRISTASRPASPDKCTCSGCHRSPAAARFTSDPHSGRPPNSEMRMHMYTEPAGGS